MPEVRRLTSGHSQGRSPAEVLAVVRSYLPGASLMTVGLLLLIFATPTANTVLSRTSTYGLSVNSVHAGKRELFPLTREKQRASSSSAITLTVEFQMRALRYPGSAELDDDVVTIGGVAIPLDSQGILLTVSPYTNRSKWFPLLGFVPIGRWQTVRLSAIRSHSLTYWLDGIQRFSFALDGPRWELVPAPVVIGLSNKEFAKVEIRDFRMRVITFGPALASQNATLIRVLQFVAAALIAIGTAVLASRLLKGVVRPLAKRNASLALIAIGTTALGIIAELIYEVLARAPPEPHDAIAWWLYNPYWRFTDYWQTLSLLQSRNPYGFAGGTYPPVGYWILEPFAWMKDYPSLYCAEAIFVGFVAWLSWSVIGRSLSWPLRIVIGVVILCSLPVSFALDRGNTDFLIAMLLLVGAGALEQRRHYLSATLYALAGAAKIIPILYLAVFIRRRRLAAFACGVLVAVALTFFAFAAFGPIGAIPTEIRELRMSLASQTLTYLNPKTSTPFNTSITAFIQAIAYALNGARGARSIAPSAQHYVGLEELVGTILVLFYVVIIERRSWRALTMLTVAMLLLPEVTGYYALTYLLGALLLFSREADLSKRNMTIAVLFGLIFAPKAYAFFGSKWPLVDSSVLVTAPLLVALSVLVALDGIGDRGGVRGLLQSARTFRSALPNSRAVIPLPPLHSDEALPLAKDEDSDGGSRIMVSSSTYVSEHDDG
jgi:hypothetical protein